MMCIAEKTALDGMGFHRPKTLIQLIEVLGPVTACRTFSHQSERPDSDPNSQGLH
jgi:hypothetical protein